MIRSSWKKPRMILIGPCPGDGTPGPMEPFRFKLYRRNLALSIISRIPIANLLRPPVIFFNPIKAEARIRMAKKKLAPQPLMYPIEDRKID